VACQGVEDLAGDGAFEGAEHGLVGPAFGEVGVAVGAGPRVVGHADLDDVVQGGVGLPVPAAAEAVSAGLSGGDRDRDGATQGGERRGGAKSVWVVAGGDQQLGADGRSDALDGHQGRVGPMTASKCRPGPGGPQ